VKRVLVTGAQGFIGRHLVSRLLEDDPELEVLGLGRSTALEGRFSHGEPLPAELRAAFEAHRGRCRYKAVELRDTAAMTHAIHEFEPDCVFHLASALHTASERELLQANVEGTLSLLDALGDHPALMVQGSSASVYGEPRTLPISEDHPCRPVDLYGVSKHTAEQLVAVKAARAGIPYLIARIFNVVGPGQTALHVCGRFARGLLELEGETHAVLEVGPLAPTRDFVDVRDLSDGLMLLARRGMPGETYNLASGRETAVGEILRELVRLSGIEVAVVERGDRPAGVSRHVADISKARRLGYLARHPLSQSLRDLLCFQRSVRASGAPPIVPSF